MGKSKHLICINRTERLRDRFQLYPRQLCQRVPRIRVPLADGDPDVVLDVQAVLAKTYESGSHRDSLRSDRPCVSPLPAGDQAWANELIRVGQQVGWSLSDSEAGRSGGSHSFSFRFSFREL